jgi:hypothetical protein
LNSKFFAPRNTVNLVLTPIHFSMSKRCSGVSRIERCIRLDDVVNQSPGLRPQTSSQRTHHAGCNRVLETIRVPDGHNELPHAYFPRVSQFDGAQPWRIDAQHRKVSIRIFADQLCFELTCIRRERFDAGASMNHVAVRNNETVGGKDKSTATSSTASRIVHLNSHHGRAHPFGNRRNNA